MRRRLAALTLCIASCRGGAPAGQGGGGDGDEREESRFAPAFIGSDDVVVPADQVADVELAVKFVYGTRTMLVIDDLSVGTLPAGDPIGELDAASDPQRLRLRMGGALVPASHTLRLLTEGDTRPLYSQPVTMHVRAAKAPRLRVDLAEPAIARGRWLAAQGADDRGLILLLDQSSQDDATLTLFRSKDGRWDLTSPLVLGLPGHVADPAEPVPAIAAALSGERLVVAWRVGLPGEATSLIEIDWGRPVTDAGPKVAVALADAVPRAVEWAALGRPFILGDTLVVEVIAAHDTEIPHPGDQGLAALRLDVDPRPSAQPIASVRAQDMAAASPVIDPSAPEPHDLLSVILDASAPALLRAPAGGGLPALETLAIPPRLPPIHGPAITLRAALGGYTVAAMREGGALLIAAYSENGTGEYLDLSPERGDLPSLEPTGAPAAGVVMGAPLFLVPYGAESPVHLAVTAGEAPARIEALVGVHCDQVALPFSSAGNREGAVDIACLLGGVLRLGTVALASG